MMMAQEEFVRAEVEYRLQRAAGSGRARGRRLRLPRRPTLSLPHPRRRPLSLA